MLPHVVHGSIVGAIVHEDDLEVGECLSLERTKADVEVLPAVPVHYDDATRGHGSGSAGLLGTYS
jgi:hypothetical protein